MMKDGWLQDDDGWAVSSVGIVTLGDQSYVIAVYVRGYATLDAAWQTIETLCRGVVAALLP